MIAGVTLPDGDPFLQRQNEPSVAVSTRNPQHLLAGANDYRTVNLPGLPDDMENGDAWLGLYKSFDGGQTWKTNLLPGYPQDASHAGVSSPLHGFSAAADPIVRAGVNGLFFYTGIAFNRGATAPGAIFVSRFIDHNNKENGDPIAYLGTTVVQRENNARFIDKPWLAVDVPRGDGAVCTVDGRRIAAGKVYVVYTVFNNSSAAAAALGDNDDDTAIKASDTGSADNDRSEKADDKDGKLKRKELHGKIMFSRSRDCGVTWTSPERVSAADDVNQGATIAIDPASGTLYIAWRQFADAAAGTPNELLIARSRDGGNHFDSPTRITARMTPFDQATTATSFRTNAYPTLTIDETGRLYAAWSSRGFAPMRPDPIDGDGRVVLSTSSDGVRWTAPQAIDNLATAPGHQMMPALAYAAGRLQIAYYDLREDVSEIFGPFVDDRSQPIRHTIDVRTSQAASGANPVFTSYSVVALRPSEQVSAYLRGSRPGVTNGVEQLQYNPPNLPMFKQGTAAFLGDYIDLAAAPAFVPTARGGWAFNTSASNQAVFHLAWTDNRDVRAPRDGNWAHYTPPTYAGPLADPSHPLPACEPGQTGMRNQNAYASRISPDLLAGSPGNAKPLSSSLPRGFVVYAQNTSFVTRTYQFRIERQPTGGRASFSQFPAPPFGAAPPPPLTVVYAVVPPRSMAARTVYAPSTDPRGRIDVDVAETTAVGQAPAPTAQRAIVALNPDIANPDIANPDIANPDIANPDIANAEVVTPDIANPDIANPDIANPDIANPDIANPDIANVSVVNPDIANPDIANPDIANPDIANPDIANPDIANGGLADVVWTATNTGNTAAAYSTRLFLTSSDVPAGTKLQLIVNKQYKTPVALDCELKTMTQNQVVVNVTQPRIEPVSAAGSSDPNDPNGVTFFLAPGETAQIVLRVFVPVRDVAVARAAARAVLRAVVPAVQAQAVSTPLVAQGIRQSPIATPRSTSQLAFAPQPADAIANQPFVPAVRVRARAIPGGLPGVTIQLALPPTAPGGAPPGSTTAVTNAAGV